MENVGTKRSISSLRKAGCESFNCCVNRPANQGSTEHLPHCGGFFEIFAAALR